jgi:hypothetical protein
MATPRVFVSSTCYDLQEIRYQMRKFIGDYGFDPVMSEFGDIFYNSDKHVQDACKDEIEKCNLFVLIIGNNYGSLYHSQEVSTDIPQSITLHEFKKALDTKVAKHIYVNKYVNHDYNNYKKALDKKFFSHFASNEVDPNDIDKVKNSIRLEFDESYPFPNETYKYIFYFLDIVYAQKVNNAIIVFESFDEIKESLRKQWAGFVYESLTRGNSVKTEVIEDFSIKLDKIESQIRTLVESKVGNNGQDSNLTFNLEKLIAELSIEDIQKVQVKISSSLNNIMQYDLLRRRGKFRELFTKALVEKWLDSLEKLVKDYKWSKTVNFTKIFKDVNFVYWPDRTDVPFDSLLELYGIYKNMSAEDLPSFVITVKDFLNKYYEKEPTPTEIPDSDLPF